MLLHSLKELIVATLPWLFGEARRFPILPMAPFSTILDAFLDSSGKSVLVAGVYITPFFPLRNVQAVSGLKNDKQDMTR